VLGEHWREREEKEEEKCLTLGPRPEEWAGEAATTNEQNTTQR